jgi:predicted nucleotidyltransferase
MLNIEEIKQLIVEKLKPLNPYQIILFGSYAYETPTKDSDLDICIIDKGEISKRERKLKIRKALKEIKIAKDILVERYAYFMAYSDENWMNTALYDVRHRGVILYEQKSYFQK